MRSRESNRYLPKVLRCRRKFLALFPGGFTDEQYIDWERGYKAAAHKKWEAQLNKSAFESLLSSRKYAEIAATALGIESRTNLLFSFEKMALRDAVKSGSGSRLFSEALYNLLYEPGSGASSFDKWCAALSALPRKQTRVLTWPAATVFPFIAQPRKHFFFKPKVTRIAADAYGYDLPYTSRPSWKAYSEVLKFARTVKGDIASMKPRDMIDIQSFLWVLGSDEYS